MKWGKNLEDRVILKKIYRKRLADNFGNIYFFFYIS